MQANQIISSLNPNEKTIIISPFKYHTYLKNQIKGTILNVSIYDPNMLVSDVLANENIEYHNTSSIIRKIKINEKLKGHKYHNNINFIDQLFKLENEFNNSNIKDNHSEYSEFLDLTYFDFSNVSFEVDRLIVFEEGLLPIHKQVIEQLKLNDVKVEYIENKNETSLYYEYENSIEMLNSIFDSLLNETKTTLIICDDQVNKDYLKNLADNYNIEYGEIQAEDISKQIFLQNIFNSIDNNVSEIEINNDTFTIDTSDYQTYLKDLYNLLVSIDLFNLNYLNTLFKNLYINEAIEISLLNKWLLKDLSNKLKTSNEGKILFADSSFNSVYYERVIIVDASLKNFKPQKVSYLLNVDQRHQINPNVITNLDYDYDFKQAERRLINCGQQIEYHYCLLDIDNNSNDLAYFIKDLNGLLNLDKKDYLQDNPQITYYINEEYLNSNINDNVQININPDLKLNISPSALDSFYNCPYQYFISYLVKPRASKKLDSALIGTVVHSIIHDINLKAINNGCFYNTDEIKVNELIKNNEEYLNSLSYLEACYHEYYFQYVLEIINYFIEQVNYFSSNSDYKIKESEKTIEKNINENIVFKGTIDAIFKDGENYLVIDYKSSDKLSFDVSKLELGIRNQLISYLKLIDEPAQLKGAFYQSFKKPKVKVTTSDNWLKAMETEFSSKLKGVLFYDNENLDISSERDALASFDYQFALENKKNHVSNISNIKLKLSDKNIKEEEFRNKKDLIQYNSVLEDDYFKILQQHIDEMINKIKEGNLPATPYSEQDSCLFCSFQNICKNYDPEFVKENDKEGEEDV